jgi:hypothetical protein
MIPTKLAIGLDPRVGTDFRRKIMLQQRSACAGKATPAFRLMEAGFLPSERRLSDMDVRN